MKYFIKTVEAEKRWNIEQDGAAVGDVERFATGYMVTLYDPPSKIKRFRMIDALHQALGDDATIVRENDGPPVPNEG